MSASFMTNALTELSPILLPLQLELQQHLFLLLCLLVEAYMCPGLHCVVVGGLELGGGFVATIHHLGDVVADTLGPGP